LAQPALSRVLADAERLLGVVLFERSHLGTRITAQGRSAVGQAEYALRAMEAIPETAKAGVPTVRLGCIPRGMHVLMPWILDLMSTDVPALRLRVSEGATAELWDGLRDAALDFAIARRPFSADNDTRDVEAEMLYDEKTVVVCAKDNELVSTGPVSIRQLARLTWVLTKPGNYSRDLIDQIVLSAGLAPLAPLIEAQSFESSLSVVAATRIISIAPESAARRYEELGLIRTVQLRPALATSPVMLLYRASVRQHPAFDAFRDLALRAARLRGHRAGERLLSGNLSTAALGRLCELASKPVSCLPPSRAFIFQLPLSASMVVRCSRPWD
jgi:DNA-binding transcriptional LysR family regulator